MKRTYWTWAWSLAGASIGAYLTVLRYTAIPVGCPATATINCQAVLTSSRSMIGPLPLATWGLLWALVALVLRRGYLVWAVVGLAGIVWAVGHEIALGQLCLWCTAFQLTILADIVAARPAPVATKRGHAGMPKQRMMTQR